MCPPPSRALLPPPPLPPPPPLAPSLRDTTRHREGIIVAVGRPARCVNCARLFIFSDSRARDACKCTAYVLAVEHFARSGKSRVGARRWRSKTSGKSDGIPVIPSTKRFAPLTRTRGERKKERAAEEEERQASRWLWQWERRKHDEFIAEIRYARIGVARRRKHSRGETFGGLSTGNFVRFLLSASFVPSS